MADLKQLCGIDFENPVIISSSGLTNSAAKTQSWKLPVQEPLS